MHNDKLTAALAALKKATNGDGVVAMNAEELTKYAEEQITKAAGDEDKGDARIAALTAVVSAASDVFKASPTAKFEFVPHAEKPAEGSLEALARDVATIKSLLSKGEADQTKAVIHPPPVPEGFDGGSVSTNQPQGDDHGPRSEATKSDAAPAEGAAAAAEAKVEDAPAEGSAAAPAEAKVEDAAAGADAAAAAAAAEEDAGEDVAKADSFSWPTDMAKDAQREKAEKRAELAKRSKAPIDWGRDGEAPPSA